MINPLGDTDTERALLLGGALTLLFVGSLLRGRRRSAADVLRGAQPRKLHTPRSTLPLLGNALDAVRHEARFHSWISDRCIEFKGEPWVLAIPGQPATIVCSTANAIEAVTVTHFAQFPKGQYQIDLVGPYFGLGIAASDGPRWQHQRRAAAAFFSAKQLRAFMLHALQKNVERASRHVEQQMARDATVDLKKLFHDFTIDTFVEVGMGVELGCIGRAEPHPILAALEAAALVVSLRFRRPEWFWKWQSRVNTGSEAVLTRSMKTVTDWLRKVIHTSVAQSLARLDSEQDQGRTKSAPPEIKSVVELFIEASHESKEGLKEQDIVEFILTFVVGARETTADTLSWLFYMLHKHPEVEARLRDELAKMLPANLVNKRDVYLTTEQIHGLVYLEAVIKETVRLYPAGPFTFREAAEDTVICGDIVVRKGERVALPIYAIARNPAVWGDDAAEFKPERWIDPATGALKQYPATQFFSFSAGPRVCIGMQFAMLELRVLTANLLNRFRFMVDPETNDGSYLMSATLVMRDPLDARVTPTSRAQAA